jgi:hypothetical protein
MAEPAMRRCYWCQEMEPVSTVCVKSVDPISQPEWCLFCGSDTCEHAAAHNAAISGKGVT